MNERGQIWVETVIYTLIGLSVIGLVLSAALPKIEEKKSSVVIEQSIDSLTLINEKVTQVKTAVGNRRIVDLDIDSGELVIDSDDDTIAWIVDSSFLYSELGVAVSLGQVDVTTSKGYDDKYSVELRLSYDLDIRYDDETSGSKVLSSAATAYNLVIENVGIGSDDRIIVNVIAS